VIGTGPSLEGHFERLAAVRAQAERPLFICVDTAYRPLRQHGIITDLVVTKLDVLSGLDPVPICVGYEIDGERLDDMPMTQTAFHHARPVYEEVPGWSEDISKARTEADLPANARRYVERIEELCGARVSVVGVGPGREENVIRHELVP